MEVYIEYVVIDNIIINSLICLLTGYILKMHYKKWRIFLTSVLGCVVAIFMPFLKIYGIIAILFKLLVGAMLVLTVAKYKSFKEYFINYLVFLTFTFVLGGCCFGIMFMLGSKVTINGLLINGFEFPISLLLGFVFCYVYWLMKLVRYIRKDKCIQKYKYKVNLYLNNCKYELDAFLDSGNKIYDEGKPVMVLSLKSFQKIFKQIPFEKLLLHKITNKDLDGAHYIQVGAVNGKSKMLVFCAQKLEIEIESKLQELNNPTLGLAIGKFQNQFELLLHPDCF